MWKLSHTFVNNKQIKEGITRKIKITQRQMKMKYNVPKHMRYNESNTKGKIYSCKDSY